MQTNERESITQPTEGTREGEHSGAGNECDAITELSEGTSDEPGITRPQNRPGTGFGKSAGKAGLMARTRLIFCDWNFCSHGSSAEKHAEQCRKCSAGNYVCTCASREQHTMQKLSQKQPTPMGRRDGLPRTRDGG